MKRSERLFWENVFCRALDAQREGGNPVDLNVDSAAEKADTALARIRKAGQDTSKPE